MVVAVQDDEDNYLSMAREKKLVTLKTFYQIFEDRNLLIESFQRYKLH